MTTKIVKYKIERKINIDVIFIIMIFLSVITTYSFFRVWNRPTLDMPTIDSSQLKNSHIDSCTFGKKDITVVGWAFTEGNSHILNRIFAKRNDGEWIELMSSTISRPDISEAFKTPIVYDRSGFIATRRDSSSKSNFSHEIMIISVDSKGIGHAARHHCQ